MKRATGVDCLAAFNDLSDYALLVDYKGNAVGPANNRDEDVVSAGNGFRFVAQDGEGEAEGLGERFVLLAAVDADAQRLGSCSLKLGDISLIRLELARSTGRPRPDIERQHHRALAAEIAEANDSPVLVGQGKIRRGVSGFECSLGHEAR